MVRDCVTVVRGKQIVQFDAAALRREADRFDRVIVDLGAGDGRWIYRLARSHASWLCIGIDANAQRLRDASFRAGRKADRGGAGNVWYLCAAVEALPGPLDRVADEVHIHFPWGSLLQATLRPDPPVVTRIAQIGKPGATLSVQINVNILEDTRVRTRFALPPGVKELRSRLSAGYAAAGIQLIGMSVSRWGPQTSWSRRLSDGRPRPVLSIEGVVVDPAGSPFSSIGSGA